METKEFIYFDNASTTPVDQRVVEAMLPYFCETFGNASSMHTPGTVAKNAMESARATLAGYIGASPDEIVFTSGGTEANNFAIKGIAFANRKKGNHIIVSSIEHDCILNASKWLEEQGFYITYLPVKSNGIIDLDYLRKAINPKTILVSVMFANNEIGTIQPIDEIGRICHENGTFFHSDACQSFTKIPVNVNKSNIDLLTINAHKIYGPKGIGALYIKRGTPISPLLHGGGQEFGLRSTTENIPAIVGFAKATEICMDEMNAEVARLNHMRDKLVAFLFDNFDNVYINGDNQERLPGHLNFSFHGQEGETIRLLFLLDEMGIAVSAGSACSSNHGGSASHVLQAIGLNPFEARGGIRVSFGRFTTEAQLEKFFEVMSKTVLQLNSIYS